eukprot:6213868-Pleurochrysis_carterae.AAC.6
MHDHNLHLALLVLSRASTASIASARTYRRAHAGADWCAHPRQAQQKRARCSGGTGSSGRALAEPRSYGAIWSRERICASRTGGSRKRTIQRFGEHPLLTIQRFGEHPLLTNSGSKRCVRRKGRERGRSSNEPQKPRARKMC